MSHSIDESDIPATIDLPPKFVAPATLIQRPLNSAVTLSDGSTAQPNYPKLRVYQHLRWIPEIIGPRGLGSLNHPADSFPDTAMIFAPTPHIGGDSKKL